MNKQHAIAGQCSMFETSLYYPDGRMLKPVSNNSKLGNTNGMSRVFTKGAHKGLTAYSLTLEERRTCDVSCKAWDVCYGNKMPFANRYVADDSLMPALTTELKILDLKHPDGVSIRLHILGDFYSVEYVKFWEQQLLKFPVLHIWGYTHRTGEIRREIHRVWRRFGTRFNILQSDSLAGNRPSAYLSTTRGSEKFILCPEQDGKTSGCLTCGLCTGSFNGVRFEVH